MPQVVDPTGALIELPPEQIAGAWKSGQAQLVAGAKYHVRMPTGEFFSVPAESLHTALGNGGAIVSDADVAAHKEEAEYGGVKGHAIAFGAGALEQGTFGLGTSLLPDSTHAPIDASRRQNPWTYGAGELAGAAGLSAVLPGGGAAGLVERGLGGVATGFAEGAGEGVMSRIAARAAVGAAKATAEGAQFGAAQALSDDAIADHHLTAAQMLSAVKANAMWGGALGAGFGVLGGALARGGEALARPAAEAVGTLDRTLAKGAADADVASAAAKAIGADAPAEGLGAKIKGWYAKVAAAASGGDEKTIANFVGKDGYANRAALLDAEATRTEAAAAIREHVGTVLEESKAIQDQYRGTLKREQLKLSTADVDPAVGAQHARDMADKAISSLDEMAKNPDDYGGRLPIKNTLKITLKYSAALDEAIKAGDVAEQYGIVDDIKRAIGRPASIAAKLGPGADELVTVQNRARAAGLSDAYHTLREGLENEDVWGKAATDQKAINKAWTTNIDASNRFHAALTTEGPRVEGQGFERNARIMDPAKIDSYVKNLTNPAQDLTHKAVTDYVSSSRDLANIMGQSLKLEPGEASGVQRIASSANAFAKTLDKTTNSLQLTNQFEQLRNVAGEHGSAWAAMAGAVIGGVPGGTAGMALGKAAGLFTAPAEAIMKLARVEQIARDADARFVRGLRGFQSGGKPASVGTEVGAYARKAAQVQAISANPAMLQERIAANTTGVRMHAPKLASALTMTSLAGLAFLRDKLPPSLPLDPLDPKRAPPQPPPSERAKWLRYYDAVKDPGSVVEDLRGGRLSAEGIEVLKTVYPPLYKRAQELTFKEMAEGRLKDLTSQQRLGLGLMLELPLPELAPAYIQARQAAYANAGTKDESQQAGAQKPGAKRRPINLTTKAAAPTLAADRVAEGAGAS